MLAGATTRDAEAQFAPPSGAQPALLPSGTLRKANDFENDATQLPARMLPLAIREGARLLAAAVATLSPAQLERVGVAPGAPMRIATRRGEIVLTTRYRGWRGEPFPWVYLAEADLREIAEAAGYGMQTLGRVASGEYLASLEPSDGAC